MRSGPFRESPAVRARLELELVRGLRTVTWRLALVEEGPEHVDRQREDDRRALVPADVRQRLEVAKLDRDGVRADHVSRLGEPCRRLELALGVDHLGAP